MSIIDYKPPPTIREFIKDYIPGKLFYDFIVGPVGSGKTTGLFFKLVFLAQQQAKGPDGIRRTRAVVVRNTLPQLRDTTITSWNYWFKDGEAGTWKATENKFILRFGDVECEVLFRPLDTADDVARVLSLEVTFALIDEFVQIPRAIIDALSARLGRYPSKKDGGATNFGMFGSSNPDTEDCWWYDFLHNENAVRQFHAGDTPESVLAYRKLKGLPPVNVTYFVQPSGLSEGAENLENLPPSYYDSAIQGKSDAWVKQFVEAEWGFSAAGKAVVPTFKPDLHVPNKSLLYNPQLPLVFGFDPGLAGTAAVFGQQDLSGRLLVLGELTTSGYGTQRFIEELLRPYIRRRFPDARLDNIICAPDPAASNRAQTDEKAVVDVIRRYFTVKSETNNRLPLRLDAIEHFTTRLVDAGPALLVSAADCPETIRALKGGWRYAMDLKKEIMKGAEPEKNPYSHVGDAFGYLCRYFHRQSERELRYSTIARKPFVPPRFTSAGYHFR